MLILPAIDLLDGKCVRLLRGSFETAEKVASDAVETAQSFERDGAEFIHIVDLNGARSGQSVNHTTIENVVKKIHLPIEVGGGIRSMEKVDFYINLGVQRVIIGSAALNDHELVKRAVDKYGERIAVGIDALDRMVRTDGWEKNSNINYIDLAKDMENIGVKYIIFTDISKDGTLNGPNYEQLSELQKAVDVNIIASGGIKNIENISKLCDMNLYGAICGKSIYAGELSLPEAIKIGRKST